MTPKIMPLNAPQTMLQRHRDLMDFIQSSGVEFQLLEHPPCRSSVESADARKMASGVGSVGAKALILQTSPLNQLIMVVLPGFNRLSNDLLRKLVGRFRFANADEISGATFGLEPGMIPPFTVPMYPAIRELIVDEALIHHRLIGFNAAHLQRSVVMTGEAYLQLVPIARVEVISTEIVL